ncbi:Hypothetical predicted protein [Lecanosticta acicola]|uniref:Uncharacterized protein n=1 Tax=Lecanosticta acicola TaxID=111012 RepID=A0AAI9E9E7_9PEZI|nr:Hypothetical predicted protein [Lecanosticta acicola]
MNNFTIYTCPATEGYLVCGRKIFRFSNSLLETAVSRWIVHTDREGHKAIRRLLIKTWVVALDWKDEWKTRRPSWRKLREELKSQGYGEDRVMVSVSCLFDESQS